MPILDEIIEALPLLDFHKMQLMRDRGLSEDEIQAAKLRSSGPHAEEVLKNISKPALKKINLMDEDGFLVTQLTKENILIPYFDDKGIIYKIRPHKYGFKGDPVKPYCRGSFSKESEDLIITEGEFKAMAATAYGYNAIAVPGISSMINEEKYEELVAFIKAGKVKNITIMFDSEDKSNPDLKNYKKDWKNRYDTDIYAYIMCEQMNKAKFNCKIALLPLDWRVEGKADIDGARSAGKTKEEMDQVIKKAMTAKEYLKRLKVKPSVKAYVQRRIERFFADIPIFRYDNMYFRPGKKEGEGATCLSNFVVNIQSTYHEEDHNKLRELIITNKYDEVSHPHVLDSDEMTCLPRFQSFVMRKGNYNFRGTAVDLRNIWEYEFLYDEGKAIYDIDHVGKVEHPKFKDSDLWMFENVAIMGDATIFPDVNGVFWKDDVGFKFKRLSEDMGSDMIPKIGLKPIKLDELSEKLSELIGQKGKLLLGWAVFCLLSSYLKKVTNSPIPFLFGEKASGKTTIGGIIMALFGMPDNNSTMTDITKVAITRLTGYYSSLPVWLDEFSNTPDQLKKEPHLKAVYDRTGVVKGVRSQFGVATYPVRSMLMITGQTIPTSDALKSRCTLTHVAMEGHNPGVLNWFEEAKPNLGAFSLHVVENRKKYLAKLEKGIESYAAAIKHDVPHADIRTVKHYSLFAACYTTVFGKDGRFNAWLKGQVLNNISTLGEDMVSKFIDDLILLKQEERIDRTHFDVRKKEIFLAFDAAHAVHEYRFKGLREPLDIKSYIAELARKNYFVEEKRAMIAGSRVKCVVLNLDLAPENLMDLVEVKRDNFDIP